MLSQGLPIAIVMCKYLDFKMAPNSNYDVKILTFKESPTAILMCKYHAFTGAPNSNCNV